MDLITRKPRNAAAWQLEAKQRPVVVSAAPYASPPPGHVTIKVVDVAVNPIDWKIQDNDVFKLQYPIILGLDIAGEVVEVAKGEKDFRIGQRVIALGNGYSANNPTHGAFQKYAVVKSSAVAELPYSIPTSKGVVLPLGITTAAAGLYQKGFLSLPLPSASANVEPLDRTLLVWGGASSVGSCAIQLAVASGAHVVVTASPKNFEYCCALGAAQCYDYHSDDVEDQIVRAFDGRTVAGAYDAVGAVAECARVLDRVEGKAIVVTVGAVPDDGVPEGVRARSISSSTVFENNVGPYIWREFLPKALDNGTIAPKPDADIVGEELRSIQLGLDKQRKGVSASKVVVSRIS